MSWTGQGTLHLLTVVCSVVFFNVSTEQALTVQHSHWRHTPLSGLGVRFLNHKAQLSNSTPVSCAVGCLKAGTSCLSFSFHVPTSTCYVFSGRVSFSLNMTRDQGHLHFWKTFTDCPSTYTHVPEVNVCYRAVNTLSDKLPWLNASQACEKDGGHLYIANTAARMSVITNYIKSTSQTTLQFKLGGNDLYQEGWFLWLDGSNVTTWYTDQPDNRDGSQNCMENTFKNPDYTSDGICDTADRYICEIPLQ